MNKYKLTYMSKFISGFDRVEYVEWNSDKPKWILNTEFFTIIAELVK